MSNDEVDRYTREPRYGSAVEPPDEHDFNLIREILDDMLYSYSHRYQDKKDKMIINMTQIAKQLGDLNIKRLMAHCVIFPTILKEFNEILFNELEERSKK